MHVIHFNDLHSSITQSYLPSIPSSSLRPNKSCYIPIIPFLWFYESNWVICMNFNGQLYTGASSLSRGCITESKHSSSSSNNRLPMVIASIVQITQTLWSHKSSKESILLCSLHTLVLTFFPLSLPSYPRWNLLSVLLDGIFLVSYWELSTQLSPQHFDQLWASGFTITCCKRIFPDKS